MNESEFIPSVRDSRYKELPVTYLIEPTAMLWATLPGRLTSFWIWTGLPTPVTIMLIRYHVIREEDGAIAGSLHTRTVLRAG